MSATAPVPPSDLASRRLPLQKQRFRREILYKSRHDDDEVCAALFGRAEDALVIDSSERILTSRLLPPLLSRYRVSFDPRG